VQAQKKIKSVLSGARVQWAKGLWNSAALRHVQRRQTDGEGFMLVGLKYRVFHIALGILAIVGSPSFADAAVLFDLGSNDASGNRWGNIGPGIGSGSGQLDLEFHVHGALPGITQSLDTASGGANPNSWNFEFGSITLNEPMSYMETDGLSFTAYLDFIEPPGVGDVAGPATVAVKGGLDWFYILPYPDFTDKLVIAFEPVTVSFGNGGLFELALSGGTLTDDNTPNTLTIRATVTLLQEPSAEIPSAPAVPEPATLGLWSLGALCLAATRFRRRK
jgi:hypothetical protein